MFLNGGRALSWVAGPVVYARGMEDVWVVLSLPTTSYGGISVSAKKKLFWSFYDFCSEVGTDFTLQRVSSWWDPESYPESMGGTGSMVEGAIAEARNSYIQLQCDEIAGRGASIPRVFLSVRLREGSGLSVSERFSDAFSQPGRLGERVRGAWRWLREDFAASKEAIPVDELNDHRCAAEAMADLAQTYFPGARCATSTEIEWLVSRAWTRGLNDEEIVDPDEPQGLLIERNGEAVVQPMTADVLRWMDYLHHEGRCVRALSDSGSSFQTGLVAKQMPRSNSGAPDDLLELMFRPAERLPFPIDLSLTCRWLSNSAALEKVARRVVRSEAERNDEEDSELGADPETDERAQLAWSLQSNLKRSGSPMLQCELSVIVAVGDSEGNDPAGSKELLRERVRATRAVFKEFDCVLKLPVGQQLDLFFQHFPAQQGRLSGYGRWLLPENVAALAPTATHTFGNGKGWLLGRTTSASPSPVRLDIRTGSRENRKTAIALLGDPGSGKTATQQKIIWEAFLDGARIVDVDGKGDHRLYQELEVMSESVDRVTLRPDRGLRGLLDPWLIAPVSVRHNAAHDVFTSLMPINAGPDWDSAVVRALYRVAKNSKAPSNLEVLSALGAGDETDRKVFEYLVTHAEQGLGQLMFADEKRVRVGNRQVTHIVTKQLPLPHAGTTRDQYSPAERIADSVQRLIGLLSRKLLDEFPDRLKVANNDEGWRELRTIQGQNDFEELQRLGRSELVVPMIGTQLASDLDQGVADLFGVVMVFRLESLSEQEAALELLGLNPNDKKMCERIGQLADGQCLAKSHDGRQFEFLQIEQVESFLQAIRTDPFRNENN